MVAIHIRVIVMPAFQVKSIASMKITKVLVTALVLETPHFETAQQFMVTIGVVLMKLVSVAVVCQTRSIASMRILRAHAIVLAQVILLFVIAYSFMVPVAILRQDNVLKTDLRLNYILKLLHF